MAPEVRLSGPENRPLGIMSLYKRAAYGQWTRSGGNRCNSGSSRLLMDYGKFKYQERRKLLKLGPNRPSSKSRK